MSRNALREVASWLDRDLEADGIITLAITATAHDINDDELEEWVATKQVRRTSADLAMIAVPQGEEPVVVTAPALRVANRLSANVMGRKNRHTDGRIAIARLVGYGPRSRTAHIGLLELGASVCTTTNADCASCPLNAVCRSAFKV